MASLAADVFAVFGLVVFVARLVFALLEFVFTAVIVPPSFKDEYIIPYSNSG